MLKENKAHGWCRKKSCSRDKSIDTKVTMISKNELKETNVRILRKRTIIINKEQVWIFVCFQINFSYFILILLYKIYQVY